MKNIALFLFMALIFNGIITKVIYSDDARLLFEATLDTEPGKELVTSLIAGGVTVSTWSNNQVNVKVYGNDEAEEKVVFIAESTESGVKVEGKVKESKKIKNLNIKVEIFIPVNYNVKLYSSGGSIKVNDLNGMVTANTSGGSISIKQTVGKLEAHTAGGNISIVSSDGAIDASSAGGNISVDGFNGNVDISTAGGHINLNGGNGKVEASTAGGNIKLDYTGVNLGIDLSTLGGNITVNLPTDFDADADIGALVGKITCDFAKVEGKSHVSSYVKAKFNNGGKVFKCTTSAGNIVVSKK
jgi:DUF4097 and DUF4098 domain-containing protein YvlB